MRSVEEQQARVQAAAVAPRPVRVAIAEAQGLMCAEEVVTDRPLPGFDQAAIDGYAVRSVDVLALGAEGGDGESAYLYALALATGDGVETDLPEAYYWTLRARRNMDGSENDDVDRQRLEAGLENILPVGLRNEIEARLAIGG